MEISNASGSTRSSSKDQQRLPKEDRQTSLLRLIGPFRPISGGHSLLEAGGSVFLPQPVLLVYRLLCTCGFVFTLVLFTATGDFHFARYGEWLYLGSGLAMCLALFSSLGLLLCSEPSKTEGRCTCRSLHLLANLTVPAFQIFLTLTLVVGVLYWSLLKEPVAATPKLLLYAVSAVVMLIDSALASRMKYRVSYVILGVIVPSLWLLFGWIRFAVFRNWMYERLDPSGGAIAHIVLLHVLFLTAPLFFGLILLCVNRLQMRFLLPDSETLVKDKESDSKSCSGGSIRANDDRMYIDLASVTANSSSFISMSPPLPMYKTRGLDALPAARRTQQSEDSSEV